MIFSKRQMQEMSDYEINLYVARKLNKKFSFDKFRILLLKPDSSYEEFKPANDANQSLTLAQEHKISISWDNIHKGYCILTNGHVCVNTKNISRGICEVFLRTDYKTKE